MAYRFRLKEPLDQGVRRIAAREIERALAAFKPNLDRDLAIHGARRRIKKIRALLRVIQPAIGDRPFKAANEEFRDAAQQLGGARDGVVLADTLARLQTDAPPDARPAIRTCLRALQTQCALKAEKANKDVALGLERFQRAYAMIDDLPLSGIEFWQVAKGLRIGLKQSRRAWRVAVKHGGDDDLHEWRKTIQRHWRHMQLVQAAWPDYYDARAFLAQEIAIGLGADHDLAMLKNFIATSQPALTSKQAETLLNLAALRQLPLRQAAFNSARSLLAVSPKALGHEAERHWEVALAK